MDYWNGGMENDIFKFYIQIRHTSLYVTIVTYTLYVLNEVSINLSNNGNMKKTLDLTLIYNHIVANSENKINGGL